MCVFDTFCLYGLHQSAEEGRCCVRGSKLLREVRQHKAWGHTHNKTATSQHNTSSCAQCFSVINLKKTEWEQQSQKAVKHKRFSLCMFNSCQINERRCRSGPGLCWRTLRRSDTEFKTSSATTRSSRTAFNMKEWKLQEAEEFTCCVKQRQVTRSRLLLPTHTHTHTHTHSKSNIHTSCVLWWQQNRVEICSVSNHNPD